MESNIQPMEIYERKKILIRFLKEYKCYEEFIKNIMKINRYKTIDNLIKEAMKFHCSEIEIYLHWIIDERYFYFWDFVNEKWEQIIINYKYE